MTVYESYMEQARFWTAESKRHQDADRVNWALRAILHASHYLERAAESRGSAALEV